MKYALLTTSSGRKVYVFPEHGMTVQDNPESRNHTMISLMGRELYVREPLHEVIAALENCSPPH